MAWHDRGWDGKVCDDPAANTYCTGSHSLLSERLAREKRVELEVPGAALDAGLPGYQPPCFWTSCAFADQPTRTLHRHPFPQYRDDKQLDDVIPAHSLYTWPFRLSMTHASQDRHGQYFPDLPDRIQRYTDRLTRGRSLVFLYLNYDNPISADDYAYALVGCVRLADIRVTGDFPFEDSELAEIRSDKFMKNFPTMNWALRLSHGGAASAVRLPYHEYLRHIAAHPEDDWKLEEMRVLIQEPALIPGFKYVSEQLHDDHALTLLYKLKRALTRAQEHNIADVDGMLDRVDEYIEDAWSDRGLYPGLGSVVSVLAELAEGEVRPDSRRGAELVPSVRATLAADEDLLDRVFALLESKDPPPESLAVHRSVLRDARAGYRDHRSMGHLLRKLALFSLTPRQIARILFPDGDDVPAFAGLRLTSIEIAANPYLLAESYVPATSDRREDRADLDREQRTDGPIDYMVIDIGMFPDHRYLDRRDDLHDLTVTGPERLRAFAVEALETAEASGHSFASTETLAEHAARHPLFYREKLAVTKGHFTSDEHLAHFRERLQVEAVGEAHYFYLQRAWNAEQIIMRFVSSRLDLKPLKAGDEWIPGHLAVEAGALSGRIAGFDTGAFLAERGVLMRGLLTRRIYCATGRPGSGKSQAIAALLERFEDANERTIVLAPTGKAALRLNSEAPAGASWRAETIDRWIWRRGLSSYLAGGTDLAGMKRSSSFEPFDNLIIDEMSMVDVYHLALIFRAIEVHQPTATKRVILVGDENQLPPIGCGKPFQDVIAHLRSDAKLAADNHVRLTTNCRQLHDPVVVQAAHLFAGRNRYHDELFDRICRGGPISDYLNVRYFDGQADLHAQVKSFVSEALDEAVPDHRQRPLEQAFNLLLKLYDNGNVPGFAADQLALDRVQLLSPYRGGPTGALGLSTYMRDTYRADTRLNPRRASRGFFHSDKIVRISNYYAWNPAAKAKELRLSNGSVGILSRGKKGWKSFFAESENYFEWKKFDAEDFELAYALTPHKAQGSEFREVLVVVPERRALLSRELIYTAMTRSATRLTLLVERSKRANPLQIARNRSVLDQRNSSVFARPFDSARKFEPEAGSKVKSKIEYMIYRALVTAREAGQLTFEYEASLDLPFGGRNIPVRPDFAVQVQGKTFYWEHLGMLDRQDYACDWRERRRAYEEAGLGEVLLTSDDLSGVRAERLDGLVADLAAGQLGGRSDMSFSKHHYCL
ncbi:MAG TPA: ATP-dependent RecD-like DNA helicase [Allosphingosinicella sp.]